MSDRPNPTRPIQLAAATVALSAASTSLGDITSAEWTGDDDFLFHVDYMPDLDQSRAFLPGNGDAYCVPTSTMNLFAYAAEWGFETLSPGPGVWQGDVTYTTLTNHLASLGVSMGTDPEGGTGLSGWRAGMAAWTDGQPLTYQAIYRTDEWVPQLSDAALMGAYGGIVNICFGRYDFNPSAEPILGSRTSGHCVTVMHASADGPGALELWVRDPANGSSIFTQTQWTRSIYDVQTMSVLHDFDDDSAYQPMDATVIGYDPTGGKLRMIDSVYALFPAMGYSWSTVEVAVAPIGGGFSSTAPSTTLSTINGFPILDVVQNIGSTSYFALLDEGPVTWLVEADARTGGMQLLSAIESATDMTIGRDGRLYVLANQELHRLNRTGQIELTVNVPFPSSAIAYRDSTDEVIVFSGWLPQMVVYPASLGTDGAPVHEYVVDMTTGVDAQIAVRESDGAIAYHVNGLGIRGIRIPTPGGPVETIPFSAPVNGVNGIAFDDQGHLIVTEHDGGVVEFAPDPACWWCWTAVSPSIYDAVQASGPFRVSRSRTNYDPVFNALDTLPTPPDELEYSGLEVLDCPGDFDNDQTVGVTDLLSLLSKWGPCPGECPENLDGYGHVALTDLLALLDFWGPCIP